MPDNMVNALQIIERLDAIESAMRSSGDDLSGYILTGVAALIGAARNPGQISFLNPQPNDVNKACKVPQ